MEQPKQDGGPAFPSVYREVGLAGMSLRDWFAGQALAGMTADHEVTLVLKATDIASVAYKLADAMIAARDA